MRRRHGWVAARPSTWTVLVPLVMAAAGVLFATSFQTAQGTQIRSTGRNLVELVREQNRAVADKTDRVRDLQTRIDALAAQAAPGNQAVLALRAQTAALGPVAGTQTVTGPVLVVSLDDAPRTSAPLPKPYGPDDVVVHQQDVQAVVNALWRGGAEAMTIMDQRVVATSAVRCVGNTLILQGRVYSPPYVITALGPVAAMQQALDADPQVAIYREWVTAVGLGYEVRTEASGRLPAYSGPIAPAYARAAR